MCNKGKNLLRELRILSFLILTQWSKADCGFFPVWPSCRWNSGCTFPLPSQTGEFFLGWYLIWQISTMPFIFTTCSVSPLKALFWNWSYFHWHPDIFWNMILGLLSLCCKKDATLEETVLYTCLIILWAVVRSISKNTIRMQHWVIS